MNAADAPLKAPMPYFGGKSIIAPMVWERFGPVRNMIEPFFGSGAVLLAAPWPAKRTETVNDLDGWLCNAWRALAADPDAVAAVCDWPVSELDLHARGDWLVSNRVEFTERLRGDPDYYDVRAAGWWIWGACCWIGRGWAVGGTGRGVHRQRPHLGNAGQGVHRQLPHLTHGRGVHRQRPHLGNAGQGESLRIYFAALQARLERVRICCGDWSRICGPSPTTKLGLTGVFLDPPYPNDRDEKCYAEDSMTVAHDVADWCRANGDNPLFRIALCGYEGDYALPGWDCVSWKANGGYGSQGSGRGRENAGRERIWFSPHCLGIKQGSLI